MENSLAVLKELRKRGCSLTCDEGGGVSCEETVAPRNLAVESDVVSSMVERGF
jgi:hypothetical protein